MPYDAETSLRLDINVYTHYTCAVPQQQKKVMYSLRLDPADARLLKEIKARDGIPESEQIRRALLLWFEQKGVAKPKRRS
jgi:hypothetical protein